MVLLGEVSYCKVVVVDSCIVSVGLSPWVTVSGLLLPHTFLKSVLVNMWSLPQHFRVEITVISFLHLDNNLALLSVEKALFQLLRFFFHRDLSKIYHLRHLTISVCPLQNFHAISCLLNE